MTIKVGIDGYGQRGNVFKQRLTLTENLKNLYDLVGVYDSNPNVRDEISRDDSSFTVFKSHKEMFENVDLVINCTSTEAHYKTTSSALKVGKDVLLEKPSTLHWKQDLKLKKLSEDGGNLVAVGYVEPFNPAILYMVKNIDPKSINLVLIMRYGPMPAHRKGDSRTIPIFHHMI